jgi:hypothetical protein
MRRKLNWCSVFVAAISAVLTGLQASDLVWIGGTGNWNVSANWSPTQVPTSSDNVFITNSGSYTVIIPANSSGSVHSLTLGGAAGTQTLSVDRATLTLGGASFVQTNGVLQLAVSQSVLTGVGNLTVNGAVQWDAGTMSGTAVTTVGPGGC